MVVLKIGSILSRHDGGKSEFKANGELDFFKLFIDSNVATLSFQYLSENTSKIESQKCFMFEQYLRRSAIRCGFGGEM